MQKDVSTQNKSSVNTPIPFNQQQLDCLPIATLIIYKEQVHSCNQAFTELCESSTSHLIDQDILNLFPEQLPSGVTAKQQQIQIAQQLRAQKKFTIESDLLSHNNNIIPVKISFSKNDIHNDYTIAVFEDLRKHSAESNNRLNAYLERFMLAVEGSGDAIWQYNLDTKYFWFSARLYELLGYKNQELPMNLETWNQHLHPDDIKRLGETFREHLFNNRPYNIEYRMRTKSGSYKWFKGRAKSLYKNNKAYLTCGTMTDITARKKAAETIINSEKKFKDTFENAAIGISHISLDGHWLKVNNKICNILGYSEEELLDKNFKNITHPEDKTIDQDNLKNLINDKTSDYSIEKRYLHKSGETIWVNISVSLAKNHQNEANYFICILEDISWRRKIIDELKDEKLKAELANTAKSTFLANMSHEIRTPMNAIIALTHLTLETELNEQQHDNLKKVQSAAVLLLQIINDILDLSKAEAGKMSIQESNVSIAQVFNEVQSLLQIKAQEKQLSLNFNIDDKIPENLLGDATRISQILINLGSNAIKFTEQNGQITFNAYLNTLTEQQAELKFKVSDNGIGISKEQQSKLFDAFTQADESISRKFGGTGLGLAISKQLCEMMNGKIWVDSQLQKGSDFYFTISLQIDNTHPKSKQTETVTSKKTTEDFTNKNNSAKTTDYSLQDISTLKPHFEDTCLLLKNSDALAIEKLKELHGELKETNCISALNLAINAAVNYDFDEALKELLNIEDFFNA